MLINDCEINYINYGNNKGIPIILLHGWGQNIQMMDMLGNPLGKYFNIYILDLPGFGKSSEPKYAWNLTEYVEMFHNFVIENKISKPIIIGHSFGGRIGIEYASKYDTRKLVLLSAPYKGSKKSASLKVKIFKFLKKVPVINKLEGFAKNHFGSSDYKNASPIMKQVLVNTVNEDLTEYARNIKCPTLLIYGTNDRTPIPITDAEELSEIISDCGLVVYENASHYAYLERLGQTISVLQKFLEKDRGKI